MMNAKRIIWLVALVSGTAIHAQGGGSQPASQGPKTNPWKAMIDGDLNAAIGILYDDYPASVDTANPDWKVLAETTIARARVEAEDVHTFGGYSAVLRRFAGSFTDEHFKILLNLGPQNVYWPRFVVGFDGGKYVVRLSSGESPKDGTEITSCDGIPVDTWVREKTVPFAEGVPTLEADVARDAPWMLVDDANPFVKRPKSCIIGGNAINLTWVTTSYSDLRSRILTLVLGTYKPVYGWHKFGKNGIWIQIPSFNPKTDEDIEAFRAIIREASTFKDKDPIVFDVRRNGGGNSEWFMRLLTSLYGEDVTRYYAREKPQLVREYRVSQAVLDYYVAAAALEEHTLGKSAPTPGDTADEARNIEQALAAGQMTYIEPSEESRRPPIPSTPPPNSVHGKVYVLTDYGCGSACLSFLDEMVRFPNVVQVGLPTHADRPYTNPMVTVLPSGMASLSSGTMIRRHRTRVANQPWTPKFRFEGDIGDTQAVESWIIKLNAEGN